MWTEDHRRAADRRGLRYPSDLTDTEWNWSSRSSVQPSEEVDRVRSISARSNAIFYVLSTGCQGTPSRPISRRVAPFGTTSISGNGTAPSPAFTTRFTSRAASAPGATPVRRRDPRRTEREGRCKRGRSLDPSGYDAGKKVLGRKRHVLVDTQGLLLNVDVHAADIQDRDGAETLLRQARRRFPFIERIVADGGYAGPKIALVARTGDWTLQIVKRSDVRGFVVLPKRWIVERTLAWISRNGVSLGTTNATLASLLHS